MLLSDGGPIPVGTFPAWVQTIAGPVSLGSESGRMCPCASNLAGVGQRIQGVHPDFDSRSYGSANLSTLVEKSGGFDIRKEQGTVHVRRKVVARNGSGAGRGSAV